MVFEVRVALPAVARLHFVVVAEALQRLLSDMHPSERLQFSPSIACRSIV